MNDRALREIIAGMGGRPNGPTREASFVITPASEVMAILCLSSTLSDLKSRLSRIVVGQTRNGTPISAGDVGAVGAMATLLRDAIRPNLAQTMEGGVAFIHGGPFGNIAHGCSSAIATQCALGIGEYVVTEAGFGSDLGAEKFMNILTRTLGRGPNAIVLVATIKAIRSHGSQGEGDSLANGLANLFQHHRHLKHYGPPVIVAINRRAEDAEEDHAFVASECRSRSITCVSCNPWGGGGEGCVDLANMVVDAAQYDGGSAHLYSLEDSIAAKIEAVVVKAYGGVGVDLSSKAKAQIAWLEKHGYANLPVCMAKTQYSLSDDATRLGAPTGFKVQVNDIKLSAGAGFLVAISGDMMLMPGLGKTPAALNIDVDDAGHITGLF